MFGAMLAQAQPQIPRGKQREGRHSESGRKAAETLTSQDFQCPPTSGTELGGMSSQTWKETAGAPALFFLYQPYLGDYCGA